jgi:DNA polymerase
MWHAVVLDFETMGYLDLPEVGAWRYAEDPTTDVICASVTDINNACRDTFLWKPGDPETTARLRALAEDPEVLFVAHNAGFEKAIWRKIMVAVLGFPDIVNSRWHDTMATCAMRRLPMELEMVAKVLGLPQQKDTEGSKITLQLSKLNKKGFYERTPDKIARSGAYCLQDSHTEVALLDEVGFLPPGERNVWLLDQRINERGVRIDLDFVEKCQRVVAGSTAPLLQEFRKITGAGDPALGLNPTQRDKVLNWVNSNGYWLPDLKKATLEKVAGSQEAKEAQATADDLPELPNMPANVARAMQIRTLLGSASIKKLGRMQACTSLDGRARGLLQYHAAGPGRWGGRLLQPQNFPRGSVDSLHELDPEYIVQGLMTGDHEYVQMMFGAEPINVVSSSLRHALIAEKDRVFEVGDFSGIEARIVLALAGQHDKTALMASGADVYIDMALNIYKQPKFDVSDKALTSKFKVEHLEWRQTGKNTILGCGFQMGDRTFRARYCPEQPPEFAKEVIHTYRYEWAPEVPKLWRGFEDAALETVLTGQPHDYAGVEFRIDGRWLTALLPSGRKLWYFNPKCVRKTMPWSTPEKPDVRLAWTFQTLKNKHWITVDAYGGIITENIVQALARDLLVVAAFKCERENMPIVLTVHDEIVSEPLHRYANRGTLKQIMEDSPDWARAIKVPVQIEDWVGERYRK